MKMSTNKYVRNFSDLGATKRPGRIDLRLFQKIANAGDGYPGLQEMIIGMLTSYYNKHVVEGCDYDDSTGVLNNGYIIFNGEVVKVDSQTISVSDGNYLYIDSNGNVHITSSENTAKTGVMIVHRSGATYTDLRHREENNLLYVYDLYISSISGYEDAITINANISLNGDIDLNGNNIDNPGTINNINYNSLIQAEVDQIANIDDVTINNVQWGYIGVLDQDLRTTDPVTHLKLTLTQTTGTAPLTITSTTKVNNLNVDRVDNIHIASLTNTMLLRYNSSGTQIENSNIIESSGALSGITTLNMNNQLTNTYNSGAPFVITSTTKVNNLNVDKVDDYDFNQSLQTGNSPTFAGLTINGNIIVVGNVDGVDVSAISLSNMPTSPSGSINANSQRIESLLKGNSDDDASRRDELCECIESDTLIWSNDADNLIEGADGDYIKVKEIISHKNLIKFRVSWEAYSPNSSIYTRLYINGSAYGTNFGPLTSTVWHYCSQDVDKCVYVGDLIQVYVKSTGYGYDKRGRNMRIYYDLFKNNDP